MKCPPYAVSMKIVECDCTKFRLWFPVFVMWPLALALFSLTLIVTLFVDAASMVSGHKRGYTRLLLGCLGVVGETRGTEVLVRDKGYKNRIVGLTVR